MLKIGAAGSIKRSVIEFESTLVWEPKILQGKK
jgi:hypothetical protein